MVPYNPPPVFNNARELVEQYNRLARQEATDGVCLTPRQRITPADLQMLCHVTLELGKEEVHERFFPESDLSHKAHSLGADALVNFKLEEVRTEGWLVKRPVYMRFGADAVKIKEGGAS